MKLEIKYRKKTGIKHEYVDTEQHGTTLPGKSKTTVRQMKTKTCLFQIYGKFLFLFSSIMSSRLRTLAHKSYSIKKYWMDGWMHSGLKAV